MTGEGIQQTTQTGYLLADANLKILTHNPTMQRWAVEDMIGEPITDLFFELVGLEPLLYQLLDQSDMGDQSDDVINIAQIYRQTPDGEERYLDLQVEAINVGQPMLLVLVSDSTEQARLKQTLRQERNELQLNIIKRRQSEDKYSTLVNNMQDGVFALQGFKVQFVNKPLAEMLGYQVEELQGRPFQEFVAPEDLDKVVGWYQNNDPIDQEIRLIHKDQGSKLYVNLTAGLASDHDKPMTIGTVKNITERKIADVALLKYQKALKASYDREQKRRRLSDTLREVAKIVSGSIDQEKVLDLILDQLEQVVVYHRATVMLIAPGDKLQIVATRDKMGYPAEYQTFAIDKYPINLLAIANKKPILLEDVTQSPHWDRDIDTSITSYVTSPLLVKEKVIGVLALSRRDEEPYSEDDKETVFAFANQVSVALEQTRLYQVERQRLERDIEIARQIQISLLPPAVPQVEGINISGFTQAARLIGGDFYNYFTFGPEHLGVAIGDVSGKGIQAALMMSLSVGILASQTHAQIVPEILLEKINDTLVPHTQRNHMNTALMYLTLEKQGEQDDQASKITPQAWNLRVCNAGLVSPFLRRRNGDTYMIDIGGLPLGMVDEVHYEVIEEVVEAGDILILSSDGLVEANNEAGEMYGFERLIETINNIPNLSMFDPTEDVADIIQKHLLDDVYDFVGEAEAHDDLSLIVVVIQ
ncbi:MAG: SpoIIE family protein phosphatase [Chloroflexota bacterium]